MNERAPDIESSAASLRKELRESLDILKQDFNRLSKFVDELDQSGSQGQISLTTDDLQDLIVISEEIRDAASDIEFESNKIREKLNRIGR